MCSGAARRRTHRIVGACKTSPAEEVNEPVEAGQSAATLFLPFGKGRGLDTEQVIDRSHHPDACRQTQRHRHIELVFDSQTSSRYIKVKIIQGGPTAGAQ